MTNLQRVLAYVVTEGNTEKTLSEISLATRLPSESVETVIRSNPSYFQCTDVATWRLTPLGSTLAQQVTNKETT